MSKAVEDAIANLSLDENKSKEDVSVKKETSTQYIPAEVMVNILKRLPGKSLVRFMTVCKSWHSLRLNYFFHNLHLDHSLKNPNILIFDRNIVYLVSNFDNQLVIEKQFSAEVQRQEASYTSNTCRGLMILYGPKWGYVLNPCTRKVEDLPKATPVGRDHNHPSIGLGFSTETLELKAVRIYEGGKGRSCEVCTLGEGTWRPIEKGVPFSVAECLPAYVNGGLYWIVKEKYNCILRFDVTKEEFTVVSFPPSLTKSLGGKSQLSLSVLRGRICLVHWSLSSQIEFGDNDPCNPVIYLYVLDDSYGFTWKCEHEIWPDMPYSESISIVISNDKVLLFRPNWEIWYSYDLQEGITCQLSTPQDCSVLRSIDSTPLLVSCEESIVPVPKVTRRISRNKLLKE
ncbi:F-box and associated interaction domains-containing protein [Rhynchospora pubera]|uniref:F-box and associated interaction domains-containing protein n=1 Tax=Rhynchospora pubera TaxID=906938 RepID=A0AAV8ETW6_9POAL|nr:F-box and associated interaction domains-containing protein [Rhynchospora pubera]